MSRDFERGKSVPHRVVIRQRNTTYNLNCERKWPLPATGFFATAGQTGKNEAYGALTTFGQAQTSIVMNHQQYISIHDTSHNKNARGLSAVKDCYSRIYYDGHTLIALFKPWIVPDRREGPTEETNPKKIVRLVQPETFCKITFSYVAIRTGRNQAGKINNLILSVIAKRPYLNAGNT
jgi:hypothetical protein